METVYQYDAQGYFVGETTAYQRLPHNCTETKPKKQAGYIPQWSDGAWKLIEDHRQKKDERDCIIENTGTPYWLPEDTWRSEPRFMTTPGPLPEGALMTRPEPDPIELLNEAKQQKFTEITQIYNDTLLHAILLPTTNSLGEIVTIEEIRSTLSTKRAELERQLQQATTVEEVEAIEVVFTV